MSQLDFEEVEHTADWALRVRGRDLRELLINAARGMGSLLVPESTVLGSDVERQVSIEALDAESLLVNWLTELAFWAETEMLVFGAYELSRLSPTHLEAVLRGSHVSNLKKHIKAVTYHGLEVLETAEGLEATVVFDV
jgi:SHS2 domain-containing protein